MSSRLCFLPSEYILMQTVIYAVLLLFSSSQSVQNSLSLCLNCY